MRFIMGFGVLALLTASLGCGDESATSRGEWSTKKVGGESGSGGKFSNAAGQAPPRVPISPPKPGDDLTK